MKQRILPLVYIPLLVSCLATTEYTNNTADLILTNATIYTLGEPEVAQSMAIQNGQIIFIGDKKQVKEYEGRNTRLLDLRGQYVYPGFITRISKDLVAVDSALLGEPGLDQAIKRRTGQMRTLMKKCASLGITTCHLTDVESEDINLILALAENGNLDLRYDLILTGTDSILLKEYFARGPQYGLYSNHLNIAAIEIPITQSDAAAGGISTEAGTEIAKSALKSQFQVVLKTNQESYNQMVDVLGNWISNSGAKGLRVRWRVEGGIDIQGASDGIVPIVQVDGSKSIISDIVTSGSPFVSYSIGKDVAPLEAFYRLITKGVSREKALKSLTLWPSYATMMGDMSGSIEKGKLADVVILDTDIMQDDPERVLAANIEMTVVGGQVIYSKYRD